MKVCLEFPEELTEQEIRCVVDALPEDGLKTVLRFLKQRLIGAASEQERIWHENVHPWLVEYWPQAAIRNTEGTSEAILELLAECGAAFAQAAEWSLEYLRPLKYRGLFRVNKRGHAKQYPKAMHNVLDKVVDAKVLEGSGKGKLHKILATMDNANAEIASDPLFQRLHKIATQ